MRWLRRHSNPGSYPEYKANCLACNIIIGVFLGYSVYLDKYV